MWQLLASCMTYLIKWSYCVISKKFPQRGEGVQKCRSHKYPTWLQDPADLHHLQDTEALWQLSQRLEQHHIVRASVSTECGLLTGPHDICQEACAIVSIHLSGSTAVCHAYHVFHLEPVVFQLYVFFYKAQAAASRFTTAMQQHQSLHTAAVGSGQQWIAAPA